MKIELDKEDIIRSIEENHINDVNFYFDIINQTTTTWEPVEELTKRLLTLLQENDRTGLLGNYAAQQ